MELDGITYAEKKRYEFKILVINPMKTKNITYARFKEIIQEELDKDLNNVLDYEGSLA